MPHLIVSSIGTSLVTNSMPAADRPAFFAVSNKRETELIAAQKTAIDRAVEASRAALANADPAKVKRLSAELNGVLCLLDEMGVVGPSSIHHVLIATDTYAGRATAGLVVDWLLTHGHSVDLHVPTDLRTSDLAEFRAALAALVQYLLPLLAAYGAKGYHITFNLTGGFKGVPGFLQALATVSGAEAVYVFEGSPTLMRIPRLPLKLDAEGVVGDNFALFRELGAGKPQPAASVRAAGIPDTLVFEDDGMATLSEWGEVVWAEAWRAFASRSLLPPRTPRLRFDKRFERDAADAEPAQVLDINNAIESFTRRLERTQAGPLRSDKFEKLTNPSAVPGSTHELYAWSGGATGRIFLHESDGVWVLDRLGGHL